MKCGRNILPIPIICLVALLAAGCATGHIVSSDTSTSTALTPSHQTLTFLCSAYAAKDGQPARFTLRDLQLAPEDLGALSTAEVQPDDISFRLLSAGGVELSRCRLGNPLVQRVETADESGRLAWSEVRRDSATLFVRLPFQSDATHLELLVEQEGKTALRRGVNLNEL